MTNVLQDRVFALVPESTGVRLEKLQATTTLSGDLGMEGDDAVEFFEKFGTEFTIDLTNLFRDWKFYFPPEGVPMATAFLVAIPAAGIAILVKEFFPRLHGMVVLGIGAVLWLTVLTQWSRWRYQNWTPQITINDLIQSASSGKWTKTVPEEVVRRMKKTKFYDRFTARLRAAGGIYAMVSGEALGEMNAWNKTGNLRVSWCRHERGCLCELSCCGKW